jgi:hypothetical protein
MSRAIPKRDWSAIMADFQRSGLTQAEFCRRRHISVSSFRSWLYGLRHGFPTAGPSESRRPSPVPAPAGSSGPTTFLPVLVRPAESRVATADHHVSRPPASLELVVSERHFVRITPGFDPATLQQLLDVLEDRP